MNNYLLFIDTETSGLPHDLNTPVAQQSDQPHIVQIAWLIYARDGKLIKEENFYISDNDFTISPASRKIHGLTRKFLKENGTKRKEVMTRLYRDLQEFQPLIVGYFMALDRYMLEVGFYRSGIENPLSRFPTFCTMQATSNYIRLPYRRYLSLDELYRRLFGKTLKNQHNALTDAKATSECFFSMVSNGAITEETIHRQQVPEVEVELPEFKWEWSFLFLGIFVLVAILFEFL